MSLFIHNPVTGFVSLLEHPKNSGFPVTSAQLIELIEQSPFADFDILVSYSHRAKTIRMIL
jgi:hypothetical protein